MTRFIELTRYDHYEDRRDLVTLDADKISRIRDIKTQRIVFLDGTNVVSVVETRQEILERIYAVPDRSSAVIVWVMMSLALLAGFLLGLAF